MSWNPGAFARRVDHLVELELVVSPRLWATWVGRACAIGLHPLLDAEHLAAGHDRVDHLEPTHHWTSARSSYITRDPSNQPGAVTSGGEVNIEDHPHGVSEQSFTGKPPRQSSARFKMTEIANGGGVANLRRRDPRHKVTSRIQRSVVEQVVAVPACTTTELSHPRPHFVRRSGDEHSPSHDHSGGGTSIEVRVTR